MYAIINSGDKQYRVQPGDRLRVPRMAAEVGEMITLPKVLMLVDGDEVQVGVPYLDGVSVQAKVHAHIRDRKIHILKMKRRKSCIKRMGHRQGYSELRITDISGGKS